MKDRVPVNPGRVLVTPENGSAAYYATIKRADNPTQEGTPLNKNSLLKDATAALFGLGADAVPDDVLRVLSRFQNGLGNEYVWAKTKTETEQHYTEVYDSGDVTNDKNTTIYYADSFHVEGTVFVLDNPLTLQLTASTAATLRGKYVITGAASGANMYKPALDATISGTSSIKIISITRYSNPYTTKKEVVYGYVNSPDPNAYPIDDDYIYMALGQLGAHGVVTGSYTGTGVAGQNNPNSLTFGFCPKLLMLFDRSGALYKFSMANTFAIGNTEGLTTEYVQGALFNAYYYSNAAMYMYAKKSADGKTIYWYHSSGGVGQQANASGVTYRYVAIG